MIVVQISIPERMMRKCREKLSKEASAMHCAPHVVRDTAVRAALQAWVESSIQDFIDDPVRFAHGFVDNLLKEADEL